MIKAIFFDLSYTLLFPTDKNYRSEINKLYKEKKDNPQFDFSDYFYLDENSLKFIQSLKSKFDLYIFTSGIVQDVPEIKDKLKSIFKEIYSAEYLELKKSDRATYEILADKINKNPSEILFIDDQKRNIIAAVDAGWRGIVYLNLKNLKKDIRKLTSK